MRISDTIGRHTGIAAFLLLSATVLLLPVSGAGIFPWTVCLVATLAGALVLTHRLTHTSQPAQDRRLSVLLGIVGVGVALYALPLPLFLTALTGRPRFEENRALASVLREADALGLLERPALLFSMTRNRAGTLRIVALALAMATGGMAARFMSPRLKRLYLRFLVGIGTALAVAGYLGQTVLPQGDKLLWLITVARYDPGPIACFVDRNHFAAVLTLTAAAALSLALDDLANRRILRGLVMGAAFMAMGFGVVFSLSRGGLIALAGSVATITLILAVRRKAFLSVCIVVLLVAALTAGTAALASKTVRDRITSLRRPAEITSLHERMQAWRDSASVWRRYPVLGAGPNAYRMVFAQHRTTAERTVRDFADNEYIQLVVETGIIGTALSALLIAVLWRRVAMAPATGGHEPLFALAAYGAAAAAAVQAVGEFALHHPYYSFVLATLVGMALPCDTTGVAPEGPRFRPWQAAVRAHWPEALLLALCIPLWFNVREMRFYDRSGFASSSRETRLARGLVWAPTWPYAWHRMGERISRRDDPGALPLGIRCAQQAVDYDPMSYRRWSVLGYLQLQAGDKNAARHSFAKVKEVKPWVAVPDIPED